MENKKMFVAYRVDELTAEAKEKAMNDFQYTKSRMETIEKVSAPDSVAMVVGLPKMKSHLRDLSAFIAACDAYEAEKTVK